jgi:hypothetical protein
MNIHAKKSLKYFMNVHVWPGALEGWHLLPHCPIIYKGYITIQQIQTYDIVLCDNVPNTNVVLT